MKLPTELEIFAQLENVRRNATTNRTSLWFSEASAKAIVAFLTEKAAIEGPQAHKGYPGAGALDEAIKAAYEKNNVWYKGTSMIEAIRKEVLATFTKSAWVPLTERLPDVPMPRKVHDGFWVYRPSAVNASFRIHWETAHPSYWAIEADYASIPHWLDWTIPAPPEDHKEAS